MRKLSIALLTAGVLAAPGIASAQSAVTVEQIGDQTLARITHQGGGNGTTVMQDGSMLSADVVVEGANNRSAGGDNIIRQSGEGSQARVDIYGNRNDFRITQAGGNGAANNNASLGVTGADNSATITQTNAVGEGYGNIATVRQNGGYNTALIEQNAVAALGGGGLGYENNAVIDQDGNDNYAEINQDGSASEAIIDQDGDGNRGVISQTGIGSSLYLSQQGDHLNYEINQTGCGIAGGCPQVQVYQGAPASGG